MSEGELRDNREGGVTDTLVEVADLNKVFVTPGKDLHVLKNVSLQIRGGQMTALMGPSGVGKSTLLHIMGTLDRPTSGRVLYEGKDVFAFPNDELARFRSSTVGFVFQFHHLLPEFDTLENVMMPALIAGWSRKNTREKAEGILSRVGLSERLTHKPGELSGGEQQRVAVARALMMDPGIVLADEPTGNLDTRTGEELFQLLMDLNSQGTTFVIVTHNESLAAHCEKIIRMRDGQIVP